MLTTTPGEHDVRMSMHVNMSYAALVKLVRSRPGRLTWPPLCWNRGSGRRSSVGGAVAAERVGGPTLVKSSSTFNYPLTPRRQVLSLGHFLGGRFRTSTCLACCFAYLRKGSVFLLKVPVGGPQTWDDQLGMLRERFGPGEIGDRVLNDITHFDFRKNCWFLCAIA